MFFKRTWSKAASLLLFSIREGKYIPLPQRHREMNRERAERGPGGPPPHSRLSGGYRSAPPSSSSSSPRPLPPAAGPQPGGSPSERSSPLSGRSGAYGPHHSQGSASPGSGSGPASPYTPASPGGPVQTPASASAATSPVSPPAPHGHSVPHSHSLPVALSDVGRPVNGGKDCFRFFIFFFYTTVWSLHAANVCVFQFLQKPKDRQLGQTASQTHTPGPQVKFLAICFLKEFWYVFPEP